MPSQKKNSQRMRYKLCQARRNKCNENKNTRDEAQVSGINVVPHNVIKGRVQKPNTRSASVVKNSKISVNAASTNCFYDQNFVEHTFRELRVNLVRLDEKIVERANIGRKTENVPSNETENIHKRKYGPDLSPSIAYSTCQMSTSPVSESSQSSSRRRVINKKKIDSTIDSEKCVKRLKLDANSGNETRTISLGSVNCAEEPTSRSSSIKKLDNRRNIIETHKRLMVVLERCPDTINVNKRVNTTAIATTTTVAPTTTTATTKTTTTTTDSQLQQSSALLLPPPTLQQRRRRHAEIPKRVTYKKAILETERGIEAVCESGHFCGQMTEVCRHCGALFFTKEPSNRQAVRLMCCKNGSYAPPPLGACPLQLKRLYMDDSRLSKQFRENLRRINSLFAMASYKTSRPTEQPERQGQGAWCYTICGQIYHFLEGIPSSQDLECPKKSHYYFLDVSDAINRRNEFTGGDIDPEIIKIVERTLRSVNPWIQAYKTMADVLEEEKTMRGGQRPVDDVIIGFTKEPNMNVLRRNFNLPESRSDIAAVFYGGNPPFNVELKVYSIRSDATQQERRHQEIKNLSPLLDPMVYPLLFPCGDKGFSIDFRYIQKPNKKVTMSEYFRYRLMCRDSFSILHKADKLFQQYIVDAWVRVETDRLWYIRCHQDKFRMTVEETLRRYNEGRRNVTSENQHVGKAYILPAKFIGSDKYRQRQYLDAMAVVSRYGKPDLFITFTCNAKWKEIKEAVGPNRKWENRPDIVCRVFHTKFLEFMDDLVQKQLWGVVLNYHYVIEFQKRGLPHAHIVVTFIDDDKLQDAESIDRVVSAVIPDRDVQPRLYEKVGSFQIHGPCGRMMPEAACTRSTGKCVKRYPRKYVQCTRLYDGDNQRPAYRRPMDGRTIYYPEQGRTVDNRFVVPYSPYALAKYDCHINFEVCGSIKTLKYLHKYLNKGSDFTNIYEIGQDNNDNRQNVIDEIRHYIECRYVSSMEASWRLLEYQMSDRSHSVMVLPVHLPGQRQLLYNEDDELETVEARLGKPSKLDSFFTLNSNDCQASQYKYVEIPEHYVWNDKEAEWRRRRQIGRMIGCLIHISPTEAQLEKYFLRILLMHIRGPTSFEDLLTVNGNLCTTFKESCERRNLLGSTDEYDRTLQEAALQRHPKMLRKLFALICCVVSNELVTQIKFLWDKYRHDMIADLTNRHLPKRDCVEFAIEEIDSMISRNREDIRLNFFGIFAEDNSSDEEEDHNISCINNDTDSDVGQKIMYDPEKLNPGQRKVFSRVIRACAYINKFVLPNGILNILGDDSYKDGEDRSTAEDGHLFYLDGPGGTGKTYLYNTIIQTMNDILNKRTIAVAWTGIAAILLRGGATVHRAFKLPLEIHPTTMPGWPMEASQTQRIKETAIIIWDEAPMTPRVAIEAVDRYLRDVMRKNAPMGGKCVLFGGDFRQILPVVLNGSRTEILDSCLKAWEVWPSIIKLNLFENMRAMCQNVEADLGNVRFSDWLLRLGDGRIPFVTLGENVLPERLHPKDLVEIPRKFTVKSLDDLLNFVYNENYTGKVNGERAILCTTNAAAREINSIILDKIGADSRTYISIDTYESDETDQFHVPIDVINSVDIPSLPPHELILKVGANVVLLRNFDVGTGQCNGTRLIVTQLGDNIIECELLTGDNKGERIWLPRIELKARDIMFPKEIIRRQFPIKLAYAMTINKSQGQTLKRVGVYLKKPCFTHGQLYVAFSRVGASESIRVYIKDGNNQGTYKFRDGKIFTRNIVFESILQDHLQDLPIRTAYNVVPAGDGKCDSNSDFVVDQVVISNINKLMDGIEDDALYTKGIVPQRTMSQLRARVAVGDIPGTSGLYMVNSNNPYRRPFADDDSDDD